MQVMLLGATGLVGAATLRRLLADETVARVVAPTRSALDPHSKLENPVLADLRSIGEAVWLGVDAVICALGTTRKKAGSDAAFREIDMAMPLSLAAQSRRAGVPALLYVSSVGADAKSGFLYTRTKGEMEEALRGLGFPSLTIVRPSVITGTRKEQRFFEGLSSQLMTAFEAILPAQYRPNSAEAIAAVLHARALGPVPGISILDSKDIRRLGGK
jgi:uncharacterized protein YbjT (DUF2867 family)